MLATSNTRKSGSSGILFLGLGVIVVAAVGFLLLQDPTPDPVPPGNGGTEHSAGPEDPERPEAAAAAAQLEVRPGDRETLRNPGRTEVRAPGETRSGTIFGLVMDDQNLPVRDATVTFKELLKPEERFFGGRSGDDILVYTKRTNKEGRYWFDNLPVDTQFETWVHHREYAGAHGQVVTAMPEEQTIDVVVLRAGFILAGRVQDSGGNPLAATIQLQMRGNDAFGSGDPERDLATGRRIEVVAAPDGSYEVKRLTAGVWKLVATHEGYADYIESAVVFAGEQSRVDKNIELGSEQTLGGVVRDEAGMPVADALVSVSRSRPRPLITSNGSSGPDGRFEIRGLPDGVHTVSAEADGYSRTSQPRVEAGRADLDLILHQKGSVSGRVTGGTGQAVGRFSLELMQISRSAPTYHQVGDRRPFSSPSGEFLFDNVEPGTYKLLASGPGFSPTYSTGFTVEREEVQGIDIQLSEGGKLVGLVVGPDGLPVVGAEVKVHGRDWTEQSSYGLFGGRSPDPNNVPPQSASTDRDGRFELHNAFPGSLKLEFSHGAFLSEFLTVDVVEGGQQDVGVIKLRRGGTISGTGTKGDGSPLSGGNAFLTRQEESGFAWFSRNGRLDTQGRFRFEGLRTGTYRVVVSPPETGGFSLFPETESNSRTVYVVEGQEVELKLIAQ